MVGKPYENREKEALAYLKTNWQSMARAFQKNFEGSDDIVVNATNVAEAAAEFLSALVYVDQIKKRYHQMLRRLAANYDLDFMVRQRKKRVEGHLSESESKIKEIAGEDV